MTDLDLRALERKLAQDPGDLVTARALYRGRLQIAPDRCPKCYEAGAASPLREPGDADATCCCLSCNARAWWSRGIVSETVAGRPPKNVCADCPGRTNS